MLSKNSAGHTDQDAGKLNQVDSLAQQHNRGHCGDDWIGGGQRDDDVDGAALGKRSVGSDVGNAADQTSQQRERSAATRIAAGKCSLF